MSVSFSTRISMLRRERGETQKSAAEALGVSQALLSHYEKGIRECNLDFVARVARYYGVSADYLLGLTDLRQSAGILLGVDESQSDAAADLPTLLRALRFLYDLSPDAPDRARMMGYFSLCVKAYAEAAAGGDETRDLVALAAGRLLAEAQAAGRAPDPEAFSPACKTELNAAGERVAETLAKIAAQNAAGALF